MKWKAQNTCPRWANSPTVHRHRRVVAGAPATASNTQAVQPATANRAIQRVSSGPILGISSIESLGWFLSGVRLHYGNMLPGELCGLIIS